MRESITLLRQLLFRQKRGELHTVTKLLKLSDLPPERRTGGGNYPKIVKASDLPGYREMMDRTWAFEIWKQDHCFDERKEVCRECCSGGVMLGISCRRGGRLYRKSQKKLGSEGKAS